MANSGVLLSLAVVMSLTSFAWLALAMDTHWKKVQEGRVSGHPAKALRVMGWLGLLITAVLCFMADRPSMAVLVWIMLLAASAPSVGMLLSYRPQLLRVFWPVR